MLDRLQNLSTRDKVVVAAAVGAVAYVAYMLYKSGQKPPEYGDKPAGDEPLLASSEIKRYAGRVNYYDVVGRGATSSVYAKPDTASQVLGAFARGTQVDSTLQMATSPRGTFAEIRLPNGGSGWMLESELQPHNPDNTSLAAKLGPVDSVVSTLSNLF